MADWDNFSRRYDRIFLENPLYLDTIKMMMSEIEGGSEACILDLGCGTGNIIAEVTARFPGAMVYGVDPSAGMRERCLTRFADSRRVKILEGGALEIPLDDGLCDFVVSNLALHHVPPESRHACAREIARVLKPDGKLIYADMFCDFDGTAEDPERARDIITKQVDTALYCLDAGAFEMAMVMLDSLPATLRAQGEYVTTVEVWVEALESAGFSNLSVADVPPAEYGTRLICARRL
jgi:ubiquinone/menaquinone biosynthesis C-methylase UbiE